MQMQTFCYFFDRAMTAIVTYSSFSFQHIVRSLTEDPWRMNPHGGFQPKNNGFTRGVEKTVTK